MEQEKYATIYAVVIDMGTMNAGQMMQLLAPIVNRSHKKKALFNIQYLNI